MSEQEFESYGTFTFSADGPGDGADDAIAQHQAWEEHKRELRRAEELRREAEIQERLAIVYKGQNRLVRQIAKALDDEFPPGQRYTIHADDPSPGDIVRQFLVTPAEEAKETLGREGVSEV